MKKFTKYALSLIIACIIGYIYYYIALPPINIHSPGFWYFLIGLFIILTIIVGFFTAFRSISNSKKNGKTHAINSTTNNRILYTFLSLTGIIVVIYIIGSIFSSPIVNSTKYRNLINMKDGNFTDDIQQISFNEIPILDKDSATLIGSRKMGSMVEYVSQFEVSDDYTQINYQGKPVRVTPLEYGNIIKWFNNRSSGIPAYLKIDMATQDVEVVKLKQGIKYSEAEHFGRNIHRYLRFHYPTYMFDKINFEIDDNGTPYYICPVNDYSIGLFGGRTISNVVLVNAVTGELTDYKIKEVPKWVDRVYSAKLLLSYYNYYGSLKHGFLNSIIGQKDCLKTTDGYNYLALDDDVWVYTGVTSVGKDKSNVGFILMNQRTAETKYYSISGADENSAMSSAEGQVQHLKYKATFPLLLNIANEPTYFIALKDDAGLVKKYAMVNVSKYQIVAIGDSINECQKTYIALLKSNGVAEDVDVDTLPKITGKITKIAEGVVDGNSHYYILLDNSSQLFDVSVVDYINIIKYSIGDNVTFTYTEGDETNTVLGVQ
ncbi:CvpA family protein [Anaeromicropila herbilytica]|uniref:CvpA family protein n=1 Tax=Anaeromicropila herbilytica TaxID=2785025 RepID=A0A7R7ID59_9FIRM|nr:CvpA family protein [Anaeromicropila herbilytica]BCN31428.1 hypothetical protein bsdtb5_27230 [Anaeromicropila herbilytica]